MNSKITKILAEEIRDSRGEPTLKVTVWARPAEALAKADGEKYASFSVPEGASKGIHEAQELRDEDGKGVMKAVEKINKDIAKALVGQDVLNQKEIDRIILELDGTPNKSNLGGNSMIGVSVACAKTAAKVSGIEVFEHLRTLAEIKPSRRIPHLYMNLINGGKHAHNGLAFQEYHIVSDTEDVAEAVDMGIAVQESLKEIIEENLGEESLTMGDEGGYAPLVTDIRKPLEFFQEAIKMNNLEGKVRLALDVAASSFYKEGKYEIDGEKISKEDLIKLYDSLIKEFNFLSIEDPFDEEDFDDFGKLKKQHPKMLVMGDDLTVTSKEILQKAIDKDSISSMIIKVNQVGTLTEALETMQLARDNGIELIVSHRSGETNDDFIADLCFAFSCFGLKSGSPLKSERMAKYQRLINISKI